MRTQFTHCLAGLSLVVLLASCYDVTLKDYKSGDAGSDASTSPGNETSSDRAGGEDVVSVAVGVGADVSADAATDALPQVVDNQLDASGGGPGGIGGVGGTAAGGGTGGDTVGIGGTTGTGGAAQTGGTTGAGSDGTTQTGGATGTGGSGGTGGTAGAGGSAGTGGSTQPSLNCSAAVTPASGYVTDFSDYNTATGTWGNMSGLSGTIFSDSALTATVDTTHGNLHIAGTLALGSIGNFGLGFNVCANVASFSSISFTLAGSAPGCGFGLEIQTYDQLPTTSNPPGGCLPGAACGRFPGRFNVATPSTTPTVVTTHFGSLMFNNPWSAADAAQVVGIQFQFENSPLPPPLPGTDAGTPSSCPVDVTIDDVKFVP